MTGREIARMVATGTIVRARIGWYLLPTAAPALRDAVRIGGCLTCVSGARYWGLWVPERHRLHVEVPANASRLRRRTDAAAHFGPLDEASVHIHYAVRPGAVAAGVADVERCLAVLAYCLPLDFAIATFDSALHLKKLSGVEDIARIVGGRRAASLQASCTSLAESGIETLVRLAVMRSGIVPRLQVEVAPGIRVDFLIDHWLVVEVDGREHHTGPEQFERDRVRDAVLNSLGFRVLHFSYRQVTSDLASVISTITLVRRQGLVR